MVVIMDTTTNFIKMKLVLTSVAFLFTGLSFANGAGKISKIEYIENWNQVAIEQMLQYKIPASITLAQAILESASGNSELALKANNHFGIKCHGWEGKTIYHDDDEAGECFRVYNSAQESFVDHSEFLTKYKRYAFLFDYKSDYKLWAHGLSKAGYATNPKYPQLLIDIIEDLKLDQYDHFTGPTSQPLPSIVVVENTVNQNKHEVKMHENGVKYVYAKKGDTFYSISKELGLKLSQLYRYNNFSRTKDVLVEGDIIYIQPKRRGKIFKKEVIMVNEDISLIDLSQKYALNINSIKRLNDFSTNDEIIAKGKKVTLR